MNQQARKTEILDPVLSEAVEDGRGDQEVAAIACLAGARPLPAGVRVVTRFAEVATLRVKRDRMTRLAESGVASAIEASKVIRPAAVAEPRLGSAIRSGYVRRPAAVKGTGRGVVVAVLDWGCDFAHASFRRDDGTTRLLGLWDQREDRSEASDNRWGYGRQFGVDAIDAALRSGNPYEVLDYHPGISDRRSRSGRWQGAHGTHVLDIAAGNGRGGGQVGVAPEADLVFVHLARTARILGRDNLGDSASLLEALDYVFEQAGERPCVVNLSVGAQGGPHDGSTCVEMGIDRALALRAGRSVVFSCGNYRGKRVHTRGVVREGEMGSVDFDVPPGDPTRSEVELWYPGVDRFAVTLIAPGGGGTGEVVVGGEGEITQRGETIGRLYHQRRRQGNGSHRVDVLLRAGAPSGRWRLQLFGELVHDGRYHAWVERDVGPRPSFSREQVVESHTTGTLCNGKLTVAVGAYDPYTRSHALGDFSGSGPTVDGRVKPELVAPGVRICAARSTPPDGVVKGRTVRKTGTSMAAPHVAGTIALMFEAARRPVPIEDLRGLLFLSARPIDSGVSEKIVADIHRYGYGYLDSAAAESAAEQWGRRMEPVDRNALGLTEVAQGPILEECAVPENQVGREDFLVRTIAGSAAPYEALVVSTEPESAESLVARGVPVETGQGTDWVEVVELGPYGERRSMGRRLNDARGHGLRGQMIGKKAAMSEAPQAGLQAGSATAAFPSSVAEPSEQAAQSQPIHAGTFRNRPDVAAVNRSGQEIEATWRLNCAAGFSALDFYQLLSQNEWRGFRRLRRSVLCSALRIDHPDAPWDVVSHKHRESFPYVWLTVDPREWIPSERRLDFRTDLFDDTYFDDASFTLLANDRTLRARRRWDHYPSNRPPRIKRILIATKRALPSTLAGVRESEKLDIQRGRTGSLARNPPNFSRVEAETRRGLSAWQGGLRSVPPVRLLFEELSRAGKLPRDATLGPVLDLSEQAFIRSLRSRIHYRETRLSNIAATRTEGLRILTQFSAQVSSALASLSGQRRARATQFLAVVSGIASRNLLATRSKSALLAIDPKMAVDAAAVARLIPMARGAAPTSVEQVEKEHVVALTWRRLLHVGAALLEWNNGSLIRAVTSPPSRPSVWRAEVAKIEAAGTASLGLWFDRARRFFVPASRRQWGIPNSQGRPADFILDTLDGSGFFEPSGAWRTPASATRPSRVVPSALRNNQRQPEAASLFHASLVNEVQIELDEEKPYVERIRDLEQQIAAATGAQRRELERLLVGARFVFDQYRGALNGIAKARGREISSHLRAMNDPRARCAWQWVPAKKGKGETALALRQGSDAGSQREEAAHE